MVSFPLVSKNCLQMHNGCNTMHFYLGVNPPEYTEAYFWVDTDRIVKFPNRIPESAHFPPCHELGSLIYMKQLPKVWICKKSNCKDALANILSALSFGDLRFLPRPLSCELTRGSQASHSPFNVSYPISRILTNKDRTECCILKTLTEFRNNQ